VNHIIALFSFGCAIFSLGLFLLSLFLNRRAGKETELQQLAHRIAGDVAYNIPPFDEDLARYKHLLKQPPGRH